jgi:predicted negative regulator of RcsB-dependent stress response
MTKNYWKGLAIILLIIYIFTFIYGWHLENRVKTYKEKAEYFQKYAKQIKKQSEEKEQFLDSVISELMGQYTITCQSACGEE